MSSGTGHQDPGIRWPAGLVQAVRATVFEHRPLDQREVDARTRILAALDRLENPFDERSDPEHVTASAVVVGPRGTVLHLHKRLRRWMQPGGHIEAGEAPSEAALREAIEETGLSVTHPEGRPRLVHVDVHTAAQDHFHLDLRYLLLAGDDDPVPPAGESPEARWWRWDEALATADESLAGALEAARRMPEAGHRLDLRRVPTAAPSARTGGT